MASTAPNGGAVEEPADTRHSEIEAAVLAAALLAVKLVVARVLRTTAETPSSSEVRSYGELTQGGILRMGLASIAIL